MYSEHLIPLVESRRPHKILSIDGGGVRGVIAIEILDRIESMLRKLSGDPKLVLGRYFDFIGGTSTGSIIASALSLGFAVDEIRALYEENGQRMFSPAKWPVRFFFNKYQHQILQQLLMQKFGEKTLLGSEELKTLLLVVLRNATTDSPWPVTNNPKAKYNDPKLSNSNLQLPLWSVVRASTAAPTFFAPEQLTLGKQQFVFVDGGLTPYNNPAFIMFLTATMPEYRIGWETGEKEMLLVSVGTGLHPNSAPDLTPTKMNLFYTVTKTPAALMFAALNEQDMLCRVFGNCLSGDAIDSEIGDMIGSQGILPSKLFTYCRYNVELVENRLASIGCEDLAGLPLYKMDAVQLMPHMQRVGKAIAEYQVRQAHFHDFLPQTESSAKTA
jgi:Patatin-like phospholipase